MLEIQPVIVFTNAFLHGGRIDRHILQIVLQVRQKGLDVRPDMFPVLSFQIRFINNSSYGSPIATICRIPEKTNVFNLNCGQFKLIYFTISQMFLLNSCYYIVVFRENWNYRYVEIILPNYDIVVAAQPMFEVETFFSRIPIPRINSRTDILQ
jgi:hypothetical protein